MAQKALTKITNLTMPKVGGGWLKIGNFILNSRHPGFFQNPFFVRRILSFNFWGTGTGIFQNIFSYWEILVLEKFHFHFFARLLAFF